jgi:hypothetical protein
VWPTDASQPAHGSSFPPLDLWQVKIGEPNGTGSSGVPVVQASSS